jgi:Pyridoxamine 5'-phosphate oxidase
LLPADTESHGVRGREHHDRDVITFAELRTTAPHIAAPMAARFEQSVLGMLGTVRSDGSPRVSPIEISFHEGRLFVGMMPGSVKSRDVERDPRISLVTSIADKDDLAGEGKLFGVAERVADTELAARILTAHAQEGGFDPEEVLGSPLFEILADGAAWQIVEGDEFVTYSWSESGGLRHRRRSGATGDVVELGRD